jgi:small multidrug resistance pump
MTRWALLAGAIACEVTGSLALKGALDRPALHVVVVLGYVASFVLLDACLRRGLPLGVAYGIWAALGVAATAVLSAAIFDEPLTLVMSVGLALIIGGVLLVEGGAEAARRDGEPVNGGEAR